MGIPVLGCDCAVCTSPDPRNRRLRTAALLQACGQTILLDAGPDVRQQLLRANVRHLDAVILTHGHADHIGGIDDLRPFTMRRGPDGKTPTLPLYGDAATIARVRHQFDYAFDPAPSLSTRPALTTHVVTEPFAVGALQLTPFTVMHGPHPITGYRWGRVAYLTDAKTLPTATTAQLHGLTLLVMNALRHTDHPLHFTVSQAVAQAEALQPRQTLLVHMTHDLEHVATNAALPPTIQLAYDGQSIELPDEACT